jgi:sugar phosphate isomerase/epimerase
MELSLSVRVAESFRNKRVADIQLPELARIAAQTGYRALCMRASVVGARDSTAKISEVRRTLEDLDLAVSMVTGDFAVPENGPEGPGCLRDIGPHLDLAEALGCDLIRICMKSEDDIPHARRSADQAAERGLRLAHQSHTLSLFETVAGSLEVIRRIGRRNFGLIYEPANLALCGQDYGPDTLKALSEHLFNVYLQNHAPDAAGSMPMDTWTLGGIMTALRPLDEPGGIDFRNVFDGLRGIGYDGYVTLHQAFKGDLPALQAAGRSADYLRSLMAGG